MAVPGKSLFLINPVSGPRVLQKWSYIRRRPELRSLHAAEHITSGPGDARRATADALRSGVDQVIVVGGDGTLSEAVNGYLDPDGAPINPNARIAVFAFGTGGDFARTIGIRRLDDAILAATSRVASRIDVGKIEFLDRAGEANSRFFLNMVSFGLGGDVARLVNQWRGRLPGWINGRLRFAAATVASLVSYKNHEVTLTLDSLDLALYTNLLIVANGRFAGGGMMLAPFALIDDGLFDVVTTHHASHWDVVKELPGIGKGKYLLNPKVSCQRSRRVVLRPAKAPVRLDVDGESGAFAPATITIVPAAVRIAGPLPDYEKQPLPLSPGCH